MWFSLRLEKQHVVAVIQFGELVELVQLGFRIEFGIAFSVLYCYTEN